jgi:hypothetical protein
MLTRTSFPITLIADASKGGLKSKKGIAQSILYGARAPIGTGIVGKLRPASSASAALGSSVFSSMKGMLIGPSGLSFEILLVRAPRRALYHFATMVGLGSFLCPRRFFYLFINAESTVSTFNNTIEVKVYIHECIFWGCSVDHFQEDNLAIFDHKIYP